MTNVRDVASKKRVVIIGGYGVFGGRLARALIATGDFDVIVAGRDGKKATNFCVRNGGRPAVLNAAGRSLDGAIAELAPFIIIDAAGPFQGHMARSAAAEDRPYAVAKAAIAHGAHYMDLSDDAAFTMGITSLDSAARAAGVAVLSGVSSVPALSAAAVRSLINGMSDVHLIESAILPGNRAPRGLSVMRAILAQAGQPLTMWRNGRVVIEKAWSDRQSFRLSVSGQKTFSARWVSLIGAPDLAIFPGAFNARSVIFRAGLELRLLHGGLSALSQLVRAGVLKSLEPLTRPLKIAADGVRFLGSDRGGMYVRVVGRRVNDDVDGSANDDPVGTQRGRDHGAMIERQWTLIVEGGDGPDVPTIPAQILCKKLLRDQTALGARPSIDDITLHEAEDALFSLNAATQTKEIKAPMVFQRVLGAAFSELPAGLSDLHTVVDTRRWAGEARVTRGSGVIARIVGAIAGFPPSMDNTPVDVTMRSIRNADGQPTETWTRRFGAKTFRSYLSVQDRSAGPALIERFGVLRFRIKLSLDGGQLRYPVVAGFIGPMPLPRWILPISKTSEFIDDHGRVNFDVAIDMPIGGRVAAYKGWLAPVSANDEAVSEIIDGGPDLAVADAIAGNTAAVDIGDRPPAGA